MNSSTTTSAHYVAALRSELSEAGGARRAMALINQRALFPHRGTATLTRDQLELSEWGPQGAITIAKDSVSRITRQFDEDYGAFVGGGSAKWGGPVILELRDGTALYLLFDHRAFLEKTDNPAWEKRLLEWLA